MKYIKLLEDFGRHEGFSGSGHKPLTDEDNWNMSFPKKDAAWTTPVGELYRWCVPGDLVEEYLNNDSIEQSGDLDIGLNSDGEKTDKLMGIPFFEVNDQYFGYAEPYCRIILDRSEIEKDGYTIFNPQRDPGEVRIKEEIKNWQQYLIAVEINRDEFDLRGGERDAPAPFEYRKKSWQEIQSKIDELKIKIVDDKYFMNYGY